jgi:methylated-DNA-[protein]-cysteine S-methyltransferase
MINIVHKNMDGIWYGAAIDAEKVLATNFAQNETEILKNLLKSLPYEAPFQVDEKLSLFSERLLETLKKIYDGEDVSFGFEMSMDYLSSYAQKVLRCVSMVPIGYFTTYGAVAKACGGSARAVGQIMSKNPFPPLIPCHRVVRSDFSLGGYGGGKEAKWEMLQREDRDRTESKRIKIGDGFLSVFPIERLRKV